MDKKFEQLKKVSNPEEVMRRGLESYNKPIYMSSRKYKKYVIEDDNGKFKHFGDIRYEDATYHKNQDRIKKYWARMSKIKGNWFNDEYSPNMLSLRLLW
jgi:hypothetical protein